MARPERLYQVVQAGLRREFPALRGERGRSDHLPAALTTFVGRQAEIDALAVRMGEGRLVTLVGPGGAGKTRLTIESGRRRSLPVQTLVPSRRPSAAAAG